MPTWPTSLPQYVLEQGYNEQLPDQTVETQMDTGPVKVRRRFTVAPRRFGVVVVMDPDQIAVFEEFYGDTLAGGSLSFDWVHPRTRVSKTFRFRKPPPSINSLGNGGLDMRVTFALETLA